jgi:hypothetical protein
LVKAKLGAKALESIKRLLCSWPVKEIGIEIETGGTGI